MILDKNKYFEISFVIPIYNEADCVPLLMDYLWQIETEIKKNKLIKNYEFIFIDDASEDDSDRLIISHINKKQLDKKVFLKRHSNNFGYGAAIQSGINLAQYDWIITFDGDGQHTPPYVLKIIHELINARNTFLLIGRRRNKSEYVFKEIGRSLLNWSESLILGSKLSDTNSGLKCFKKDVYYKLDKIIHAPTDMSFSQYVSHMFYMLFKSCVKEIIVENEKRHAGKSKIRNRDFFVALYQNLRLCYLLKSKRLFYIIALLIFSFVVPYSALIIFFNKGGMPVAGGIGIIIGFIFIILGELSQSVPEESILRLRSNIRIKYFLN